MAPQNRFNLFDPDKQCLRKSPRTRAFAAGIFTGERNSEPCLIRNISPDGAQIRICTGASTPHEAYLINLSNRFAYHAHLVWQQRSLAGLILDAQYVINNLLPLQLEFLADQYRAAKLRQVRQLMSLGTEKSIALLTCGITPEHYSQWNAGHRDIAANPHH